MATTSTLLRRLLPLVLLAPTLTAALPLAPRQTALQERHARAAHEVPPTELFDVVRVIDGDTIHIQRAGELQKLRLLSVDTEEKLSAKPRLTGTKPETVFGTETMHWAQELFASLGEDGAPAKVGLAFPDGIEERDVFGRVLCHVILPDGTDFNLQLVREGWSPYFNKYGNSRICDAEFRAAQAAARAAELGVWNPWTNVPATNDTPSASRPYEVLLPWWEARARAVEDFRAWKRRAPDDVIASEDADGLMAALDRCQEDPALRVTVFATLEGRTWDEPAGGLTLLLRPQNSRETHRGVRAVLTTPDARRAVEDAIALGSRGEDFVQNYFYVTGRMEPGEHGPILVADDPAQWRVAGPEPDLGRASRPAKPVEAAGTR